MPRIAIIVGSTRPGRNGAAVAQWVFDHAQQRTDADFELVEDPLGHRRSVASGTSTADDDRDARHGKTLLTID